MKYNKINWENSANTPLSAFNLNLMDDAIYALYEALCPKVGDLHITLNETNPSERFGGVWELYAQGRALVGVGENTLYEGTEGEQHLQIALGEEVGEYKQSLSIENIPEHYHNISISAGGISDSGTIAQRGTQTNSKVTTQKTTVAGSANPVPISTMQPSIGVYVWKRIE